MTGVVWATHGLFVLPEVVGVARLPLLPSVSQPPSARHRRSPTGRFCARPHDPRGPASNRNISLMVKNGASPKYSVLF